jgi:hypothetical protein
LTTVQPLAANVPPVSKPPSPVGEISVVADATFLTAELQSRAPMVAKNSFVRMQLWCERTKMFLGVLGKLSSSVVAAVPLNGHWHDELSQLTSDRNAFSIRQRLPCVNCERREVGARSKGDHTRAGVVGLGHLGLKKARFL